ncbi:MAG: hypothetical protein HYW07_17470 [Candidatus Latescibacteria bacterium]|nr:hypothetical protein [Candidatus Latescibacterota bacterium]
MGALFIILLLLLGAGELAGEVLRIDQLSQWETWSFPRGAVELRQDGGLQLVRFGRSTDPMLDASSFEHKTIQRGLVRGGVRVRSNPGAAALLADRDEGTWWQPDPAEGLDQGWIEVDLGRVVLLEQIRLVFPDTAGARPFRDFSVFVSEGATVSSDADLYRFTRVATTSRPNTERRLEYHLFTLDRGDRASGENLETSDTLHFMPVQYVRFVPHQLNPQAALAELEMVAVGDNIGLGTFARGGGIRSGDKFASQAPGLFDGTVDAFWNASAARAAEAHWRDGGQWFEWDLGAVFWLDRIVLYTWDAVELGRSAFLAFSGQLGYEVSVSDGGRVAFAEGQDRIRGNFDYELLSLVDNQATPRRWIFDHHFARRKVRYLFYHHEFGADRYGFNMWEAFLYGQGYPAAIEMESDFIDLGSPKSFTSLDWEAELPPGTAVQLRTKTGDTLEQETLYFDKNGKQVTKERYDSLVKAARGPTEEVLREGADWSPWSENYVEPGEAFRSPSPRRYIRFQLSLSTADPAVTPLLRSLSLSFQEPLVRRGAVAEIFPREAQVGAWEEFSYRIRPEFSAGDRGFDGVRISIPSVAREVRVAIGGQEVEEVSWKAEGDTLGIIFPQPVRRDSVEVRLVVRPLADPTFFAAFLTNAAAPGIRQEVKPANRDALKVFLPGVAATDHLIAQVVVAPGIVTPNGDQVNDQVRLSFDLLKVEAVPQVRIYDLQGRVVKELAGQPGRAQVYEWNGRGEGGNLAPPGIYLCRVRVEAEIGAQTAEKLIRIAY